jgi:thiamine biosynthesis lipoprotein
MSIKRVLFLSAFALLLILMTGCKKTTETMKDIINSDALETSRVVFAMDTVMDIKMYGENSKVAVDECEKEIYRLEKLFSATDPESDISKINDSAGEWIKVSPDTLELMRISLEFSGTTSGNFDITTHRALKNWGFTTGEYRMPSKEEIDSLIQLIDYNGVDIDKESVRIKEGQQIDFGGIAKGYLADRLVDMASKNGVGSAVISLGGNVAVIGKNKEGNLWRVGIQDPVNTADYFGVVSVTDTSVVTSGSYMRYFEKDGTVYHHIIDPFTGYPAKSGLLSMTIICKSSTKADALSTALFVMGKDNALEYWEKTKDFDFIAVTDDMTVYVTEGIADSFTFKDNGRYELVLL